MGSEMCIRDRVYVHCFLDGRDTPPASGKEYVEQLEAKMKEIGVGEVASVSGRYYAMDRDNRWDRVEKAYKALVAGEGNTAESATAGIQASYDEDVTDEFVVPFVVTKDGAAKAVSYTHLRAHETDSYLVCRLLLEKKNNTIEKTKKKKVNE